jgi:hypothetical protein
MTLIGCEEDRRPVPAAPPANACAVLAKIVPPPTIKIGDDWRVVAARYKAALLKANARIEDIAACEAEVRRQYGVSL